MLASLPCNHNALLPSLFPWLPQGVPKYPKSSLGRHPQSSTPECLMLKTALRKCLESPFLTFFLSHKAAFGSDKSHRIVKEFLNWHQISFHCVFLPWTLYHEDKSPKKDQNPCCRFSLWGNHKNTLLSKVRDSTHKPSKLFLWNRWRHS